MSNPYTYGLSTTAVLTDSLYLNWILRRGPSSPFVDQDIFHKGNNSLVERHIEVMDRPPGRPNILPRRFTWPLLIPETSFAPLRVFRLNKRFHTFWVFYPQAEDWTGMDQACGTGNGTNLTFAIPACGVTSPVVKAGGVIRTSGPHYAISAGTDPLGQDQIVFTAGNAPANGADVTCAAVCRLIYLVRFTDNTITWDKTGLFMAGDDQRSVSLQMAEMFNDI